MVNLKILLNNYWMRLSMISWIIKTKVCVICQNRGLRQTRGLDNSWHHAKTEFDNCFIKHPHPQKQRQSVQPLCLWGEKKRKVLKRIEKLPPRAAWHTSKRGQFWTHTLIHVFIVNTVLTLSWINRCGRWFFFFSAQFLERRVVNFTALHLNKIYDNKILVLIMILQTFEIRSLEPINSNMKLNCTYQK